MAWSVGRSVNSFQRALDQKPDYAAAQVGIATLRLSRGDFEKGFDQFEWRWKLGQLPLRDFVQPMWDGQPLPAGSTILLHSEQGLGNAIQFLRYTELVKAGNPATTIILECETPLRCL